MVRLNEVISLERMAELDPEDLGTYLAGQVGIPRYRNRETWMEAFVGIGRGESILEIFYSLPAEAVKVIFSVNGLYDAVVRADFQGQADEILAALAKDEPPAERRVVINPPGNSRSVCKQAASA